MPYPGNKISNATRATWTLARPTTIYSITSSYSTTELPCICITAHIKKKNCPKNHIQIKSVAFLWSLLLYIGRMSFMSLVWFNVTWRANSRFFPRFSNECLTKKELIFLLVLLPRVIAKILCCFSLCVSLSLSCLLCLNRFALFMLV